MLCLWSKEAYAWLFCSEEHAADYMTRTSPHEQQREPNNSYAGAAEQTVLYIFVAPFTTGHDVHDPS